MVRSDGKSRSGTLRNADPNELELWAVLEGLASLSRRFDVTVFTDSRYVVDGVIRKPDGPLWHELRLWTAVHRVRLAKTRSEKPHTGAHHLAREAASGASRRCPSEAKFTRIVNSD